MEMFLNQSKKNFKLVLKFKLVLAEPPYQESCAHTGV